MKGGTASVRASQQPQPPHQSNAAAPFNINPLLKLAVDTGVVEPIGGSPQGVSEYAVSPHLASEVGSVSSLAYRLGAVPVAAVHDVQMRPNLVDTESAYAPVLVHRETPKVTLYTLEVPEQ